MPKFSASYIFSPGRGLIKNGILDTDEQGKVLSLRQPQGDLKEEAGLKYFNGIITPGFINAHCHIELSHLKGKVPEYIGLDKFIHQIVTGRDYDKDTIEAAMLEADREMEREGIVAVGDISNKEDSFPLKTRSKLQYHTFVEIFNMENARAGKTLNEGIELLKKAREEYSLAASLTPHSAYTVSERLFEAFRRTVNDEDNILSIHNQETEFEDEFISKRKGNFLHLFEDLGFEKGDSKARNIKTLPWLAGVIPDRSPLLLVHNVFTTPEDIENSALDLKKTYFCLCPNSNLYISNKLPGSHLMKAYPDKVCIGTDSLSSNHRLSVLAELITLNKTYPEISLEQLLTFATINGAKILGLDNTLGSFEEGKKPGVNLIEGVDFEGMRFGEGAGVRRLQ